MSNQLGPMEIVCDAPPYHIVRACSQLGFQNPEDVRWYRMCHYLNGPAERSGFAKAQPWSGLWGMSGAGDKLCSCGAKLPRLEMYTFVLSTAKEVSYLLAQCGRCRTLFWEETGLERP
jgi:hypothetical protein